MSNYIINYNYFTSALSFAHGLFEGTGPLNGYQVKLTIPMLLYYYICSQYKLMLVVTVEISY